MYHPDLDPSPELSYILGVRYGDAELGSNYTRLNGVKDKDFAEEFARCGEVIMRRVYNVGITKRGYYKTSVNSIVLADFLRLPLLEKHSEWIEPDYSSEFLRGFFDSEGSPNIYRNRDLWIVTRNTNMEILNYVTSLLELYFDIYSYISTSPYAIKQVGKIIGYDRNGKPIIPRKVIHQHIIGRLDDIEKYYWNIDFSIARKSETLEYGLYGISHPIWEARKLREEEVNKIRE